MCYAYSMIVGRYYNKKQNKGIIYFNHKLPWNTCLLRPEPVSKYDAKAKENQVNHRYNSAVDDPILILDYIIEQAMDKKREKEIQFFWVKVLTSTGFFGWMRAKKNSKKYVSKYYKWLMKKQ